MAAAWDPTTGRSVDSEGLAELLAAADARAGNISELPQIGEVVMQRDHDIQQFITSPTQQDVLFVQLLDASGHALGQFFSRDKHESASRVCTFLQQVPGGGRVTIDCGKWGAIALRHPNGTSVQTSYMSRTSTVAPGTVFYSFEAIPEWSLGICSMFLFAHENDLKCKQALEVGEQAHHASLMYT